MDILAIDVLANYLLSPVVGRGRRRLDLTSVPSDGGLTGPIAASADQERRQRESGVDTGLVHSSRHAAYARDWSMSSGSR